jgi:hypothetical protein
MKEKDDSLESLVSAMPPHTIKTTGIPQKTIETALNLLDQLIQKAEEEDKLHKAAAIENNKACQAVGESWMVFHLKALKELLDSVKYKQNV